MSGHDLRSEPHHELNVHDTSMTTPGAPAFGEDVVPAFGESHPVPAFGESTRPVLDLSDIEPKAGERPVTMIIDGVEVSAVLVETELRAGCLCPLCGHVIEEGSQALEEDDYSPQQTDSAGQCESTWQAESFDNSF